MCDIQPGETLAAWGVGPVGQFAMDSARLLCAEQVVGIDREEYRLELAQRAGHTTINFDDVDVRSRLLELTGGRGQDKCIDAVGLEASHGNLLIDTDDRVKQLVRSETERPHALRQAITCCRSGDIVSVVGVYGGLLDKFPAGAWMNRSHHPAYRAMPHPPVHAPAARTYRTGRARSLPDRDPSAASGPSAARVPDLQEKQDGCEKVVLTP